MLLSGKVTAAPFCLWSCRGRACPARGIAWADVYGVVCRGGIYPSRDACGSGNIRGASGKPAFTDSHRAGHARPLPRGYGADVTCITAVGRHAPMPPKVRVAARSTGCRARSRRPVGRPPYVPLFLWPPCSTDGHRVCAIGCRGRRPRRPAGVRQAGVYGCFVGSGLDRSVPVSGKRAFTGSHRAGHARPLPRGFGADVTCITAAGRHAYPIASAISASVRVLRTGCGSPPPSCRTITQ